jgi:N-acetylgalactosamine kinase
MIRAPEFSIILAAGKGSRMQSSTCHKVCFPVDGVPAINRALDIYTKCGISRHIVVVGTMAGQVIETVGRAFPNVVFAYQAEASGTADAARAPRCCLRRGTGSSTRTSSSGSSTSSRARGST